MLFKLSLTESRCHYALGSISTQAVALNKLPSLSGINFVFKAILSPSDNSVKEAPFLVVVFAWANPSAFSLLVLGLKLRLEPVEVALGSCSSEVVAVYTGHQ